MRGRSAGNHFDGAVFIASAAINSSKTDGRLSGENHNHSRVGSTSLCTQHYFPPSLFSLQIIMDELYRNIFLAFACIFATTLLMLSSLIACLQVLLAVVLTLLDVSGMMYFWGEQARTRNRARAESRNLCPESLLHPR